MPLRSFFQGRNASIQSVLMDSTMIVTGTDQIPTIVHGMEIPTVILVLQPIKRVVPVVVEVTLSM